MKKGLLKKLTALGLTVATALTTACGGAATSTETSASTDTSVSTSTETSTETSTASDTIDKFDEEVSIRVMLWDRGNAAPNTTTEDNALTQWIQEQMKELYNINVEYVSVPRSGSDDSLNIMMTGGTAPDIVFTYSQNLFYNYAANGALNDLTALYEQYGENIETYCQEAQGIGTVDGTRYAVMKQRGAENNRHQAYIRQDWLDELGMDLPTTKAELETYLYAVKEAKLGGENTVPWAMSGRTDTEKNYLNFVGSYVTLESDRDAYIYSEAYMAVAPGSKDGLQTLNKWYNDGLITMDFPTDTTEDGMKADIANGRTGFVLDDKTQPWDSIEVLNSTTGSTTFVPVQCFELADGTYRNPFEYRYAMFVMIPSTTTDENKIVACMKYLNWLADPENAVNVRYTPDHTTDENGIAYEPTQAEKDEKGYPGTCDDLCIMNLNFSWVSDLDTLAKIDYSNQETEWESLEWFENFYQVCEVGKFRYPTYGYISEDEQTYGTDVQTKMIEFVYTVICAPADEFESTYETEYAKLESAGLQKILDARAAYYDSQN